MAIDEQRIQRIFSDIHEHRHQQENPVIGVFKSLGEYVQAFEAELDDDHEVGARLVSFGNAIQIHVHSIGFTAPFLITFSGVTEKGDSVRLIQHVSQLSFLLVALRKIADEPYRIGFIWDE
ncbi:hypothetical protein SRABI89_05228 [Pseudomonas koreensis]|nr:hypothetical protein SRABI89_05228 [Pseudomonas koreensis]